MLWLVKIVGEITFCLCILTKRCSGKVGLLSKTESDVGGGASSAAFTAAVSDKY